MHLFVVFIIALFLTIALVPVCRSLALKMNIVDVPDARKIHTAPMPRSGGISMALGAFVPILLWVPSGSFFNSVLAGSAIIVVSGLIDDIRPLNAVQKIIPQTISALIVIFWGGVQIRYPGLIFSHDHAVSLCVSVPLTLFVILGVTNAVNLADGLDGLAGGISMLTFVLTAFLAYRCANMAVAVMAVAMAGAVTGFLRYNTHPSTLFMGDAGSQLLGFLSIILAIAITQTNTPYSRILSLPLIGFPILDTITVMAERIIRKKSPFSADKRHFHHKLLALGFLHSEAVVIIYMIQACFIAMALVLRFYPCWVPLFCFVLMSAMIFILFSAAGKKQWKLERKKGFGRLMRRYSGLLKDNNIVIRLSFAGLCYGLPLMMAAQIMIPDRIPGAFSVVSACLFVSGVFVWHCCKAEKSREMMLRAGVYFITPVIIYLGQARPSPWMNEMMNTADNMGFIFLVLAVVVTMNMTRRKKGFRVTTLDVLVIIVVAVFPNLPSLHPASFNAGITLAKSLVIFFSYDVLAGELRGNTGPVAKSCAMVLAFLMGRAAAGL